MSASGDGEERISEILREARAPALDLDEAERQLGDRAEAEGLVEVAYTTTDSPIGTLLLAATDRGLVTVGWDSTDTDAQLATLAERIGPRVVASADRFEGIRSELERYFEGRLQRFRTPLDWRLSSGFQRAVLESTARIPPGQTRSYAEIAAAAGNPRAYRAAGSALGANPIPIVVPCHRVLRGDGSLGGYGGGLEIKERLLRLEGALD